MGLSIYAPCSLAAFFLQNYLLLKSLIKCVVHVSNQISNCSRFDAPCKLRCTSSPNFPQIDCCSTLQFISTKIEFTTKCVLYIKSILLQPDTVYNQGAQNYGMSPFGYVPFGYPTLKAKCSLSVSTSNPIKTLLQT